MCSLVILKNKNCQVIIEKGELVGFQKKNKEYIHQKGSNGWRNSDIEMFPIIGPVSKNNFRVQTKKGEAIQDQHGLLRELEYVLTSSGEKKVTLIKKYKKNTLINNSRFPKKSTEKYVFWPFNFSFEKKIQLDKDVLRIDFLLISETGMPFMLGYHPAFLLSGSRKETLVSNNKQITLDDVYKAGHNAFPVLKANQIVLKNNDRDNVEITTKGFGNFMLWTPVDNMLCIEPITQYTSYTDEKFSEQNMRLSKGKDAFSIEIKIL